MTALITILTACEGLPDPGRNCQTDADCNDNDDCTVDKCGNSEDTLVCVYRVVDPLPATCAGACLDNSDCSDQTCCDFDTRRCSAAACNNNVPLEADVEITALDDETGFVDAARSDDPANQAYLAKLDLRDVEVPVDQCADESPRPIPPRVPFQSMGTMKIGTVAEITPSPQNTYFSPSALALPHGQSFDLEFTGADGVQPTALPGAIRIPTLPAFGELGAGGQVLIDDATIDYTPVPGADHLHIVIDLFENNQLRQIRCAANPSGSSITLDPTTFGRLQPSGGIRIEAITKQRLGLNGAGRVLVRTSLAVSKGYERL